MCISSKIVQEYYVVCTKLINSKIIILLSINDQLTTIIIIACTVKILKKYDNE